MKTFISLSGSDILIHALSANKLMAVIRSNQFKLTASPAIGADHNMSSDKHPFFLSCTRSRAGSYHRGSIEKMALVTLDGRKLGYKYKVKPVDYWGPDFRRADPQKHEMEDRVYSAKPTIPAAPYIKSISLLTPKLTLKDYRALRMYCAKHKIELRFYNKKDAWIAGTSDYTTSLDSDQHSAERTDTYRDTLSPEEKRKYDIARHDRDRRGEPYLAITYAILNYVKAGKSLYWRDEGRYIKDLLKGTVDSYVSDRMFSAIERGESSSLAADFHNAARTQGRKDWKQLNRLIALAKSMGIDPTAKGIIKFLYDKLSADVKAYNEAHPRTDDGW